MQTEIIKASVKKYHSEQKKLNKQIEIILSDTFGSSFNACLERLKKVDLTNIDEKNVLLVPENLSFTAEKEILKNVCECAFNIEALSFSRLLNKISGSDKNKTYLSTQAGILVITKILMQNAEEIKLLKGNISTVIEELYKLIIQLKSCNVTPNELAGLNLKNGTLSLKMEDVSFVYSEYEKFIGENYFDNTDRMQLLSEQILTSDYLSNTNIFIAGFDSVTKKDIGVFSAIFQKAKNIVVSTIYEKNNPVYTNEVKREVEKICKLLNYEIKYTVLSSKLCEIGKQIKNGIFSCNNLAPLKINDEITVYKSSDVFDECSFVAKSINVLIKSGVRFEQIAVVCENLDEYFIPLKSEFLDLNIPYFYDEGIPLSSFCGVQFLLQVLKCGTKKFFYNDLIELCKNPFFEEDKENKLNFENYCLSFLSPKFDVSRKFVFSKKGNEELLESSENVRKKLIEIIKMCKQKKIDTVKGFVNDLKEFLISFKFFDVLSSYKASILDEQYGKVCEQIEKTLDKVFEQMEAVFKNEFITQNSFVDILSIAFEKATISVVPTFIDSVFLCRAYDAKFIDKKAVFIMGAVSGSVPMSVRDNKLISDKDMLILKNFGVEINPLISEVNRRAIFSLHQTLLSCPNKLTVSYCESFGSKVDQSAPSLLVNYIKEYFTNSENGFEIRTTATENLFFGKKNFLNEIGTTSVAFKKFIHGMRLIKEGFEIDKIAYSKIYSILVHTKFNKLLSLMNLKTVSFQDEIVLESPIELFFPKELTSASQLECYFSCPFKHFMQFGLRINEPEVFELQSFNIGTLIHSVLEYFAPEAKKINFDRLESDKAVERIFNELLKSNEYSFILEDKKQVALLNRLKKESKRACFSILAYAKNSNFSTIETECGFVKSDKLVFDANGTKINVMGKIDRIDGFDDKRIIIDYKTGNVDIELKKLWTGEKIQLYIYTLALGDVCSPCGVYYFPIKDRFGKVGEKINDSFMRMQGVQVAEESIIQNLDVSLVDGEQSRFLPIKKQSGAFKTSKGLSFVTKQQFNSIAEYTQRIISKGVNEIACGNIDVSPCEKICDWCSYSDACKIDKDIYDPTRRINVGKVTAENIETILQKENDHQ